MDDLLLKYVDLKRDNLKDTEKNMLELGEIKIEMDRVRELLVKLQDENEEIKIVHDAKSMKELRDRMDKDVASVNKIARNIKSKLEDLDKINKTSITNTIWKELKDLMGDFDILRQQVVGEYKNTIERRYFTITGHTVDKDTIEDIIETSKSEKFLQKASQEQGQGPIVESICEIHARRDAVKEMEKNLQELNQVFIDMAVMVETQAEHLKDIEAQVPLMQSDGAMERCKLALAYLENLSAKLKK